MEQPKNKRIIGNKGESIATNYLINSGHTIEEKNFRYRRFEIDIICSKANTLIFVEVKFRTNTDYGYPEEFVSNKQKKQIREAAENYMIDINWNQHIRFDIIAITEENGENKIKHFKDAFY